MPRDVGRLRNPELEALLVEEGRLEANLNAEAFAFSGLKDLDTALGLIAAKLRIALLYLEALGPGSGLPLDRERQALAAERSGDALRLLQELLAEDLGEDQDREVRESTAYTKVRELFEQFLLRGGAGLLAFREENERKSRLVARATVEALRKYLPQANYDCGIEEGQELIYSSERMQLPLSQAVLYLETVLLPDLERRLAENPADPSLQRQRKAMSEKLAGLRKMRFIPRSTPIVVERDFYTEWWSGFTADGELLVSLPIPARFRSGTNLDRLKELVQGEVVRRLAGRRVCPELDRDLAFRKSLASGRYGSSRLARFKLDLRRGFSALKSLYPALQRLEDKGELAGLLELVGSRGRAEAQRAIEGLLRNTGSSPPLLP
jgi:hypothetical protein